MLTSRDYLRVEYNVLSKNVTRDVSQSENTLFEVRYDVLWSTEKSNIDQGRRPRSVLLFTAPKHIILHKMKCCNCFITFNIPRFLCVHGSIFRDCLLFFSNSKYMS